MSESKRRKRPDDEGKGDDDDEMELKLDQKVEVGPTPTTDYQTAVVDVSRTLIYTYALPLILLTSLLYLLTSQ